MTSLKKLAIKGTIWTIVSYGASQILRFGSNLILTRLLMPDLFGLMALVNVFISGLELFSDIGLGPSIVQNKRGDDPVFLNTAWTIQVIRGVLLWLTSLVIAAPVAAFYDKPNQENSLLLIIPIVGLNTLIYGFSSTALHTLGRQMSIGKLAALELGGQIISTGVMIVLAWFYKNIWALVIGNLVSGLIQMVWSHFLVRGERNRFAWDKEAAQSIFAFGKWIFVATALTFLALQSDRMILGKLVSFEMLGVYGIAFTLADIPRSIILALSGKVIFPAFSKLSDLPRSTFRDKILKNRQPILLVLAIGLTILISFGDRFIFMLYKPEYHQAGWMLPIIAFGIWHTTLYSTMSPALLALGKSQYGAQGYLFSFLTISIGLPLAFQQWGMLGAILVVACYDLPVYAVNMYGLWREGMICIGQDLKATFLFLGLLSAVLFGRVMLGWGLPIAQILQ